MEWLIHSFQGLPRPEALRRRRVATGDTEPEIGSNLPLGPLNDAGLPSQVDETSLTHTTAQAPGSQLIIELTVNRICRIITIMVLGFWGGWSLMPEETKVPLSPAWVAYICIVTDWIVLSSNLDCMFPGAMDWYFRDCPKWRILIKEKTRLEVTITGYQILCILLLLGVGIFKYVLQKDQPVLNRTDLIGGGFLGAGLILLGCVKAEHGSPVAWFFHDDYSGWILNGVRIVFAWLSWWWIAHRILAIVHILRNRGKPELALQFFILTIGLAIEGTLLVWFFLMPAVAYFFKSVRCDQNLWDCHLAASLAMFAFWLLVIVIGLWGDLPNIFFPCTGSNSIVCKVVT